MQNEELARLLGYLPDGTPIWQQVGFAPEDDEDDGDEGDDEEQDNDEDEDEEDEYVPPTREEFEAMQRKVTRYKKGLAKYRLKDKGRAADDEDDELDDEDEDKPSGKGTDRKELKRLLARAEARAEAKYKPALVKQAAKSALVEAGFAGEITSRTMGLLDLDSLDVDEDGEILGLEDAIDELKEDLPQLFRAKRRSSSATATSAKATGRRALDGGNKKTVKKESTFAEKIAARLGE